MLFNKHELRIRVAKTNPPAEDAVTEETAPSAFEDPEMLKDIALDFAKGAAVIVIGVLVVSTILTIAKELIVQSANSDD